MCEIKYNGKQYINKNEEENKVNVTVYDTIQYLYDECEFEKCLEVINKVLNDVSIEKSNSVKLSVQNYPFTLKKNILTSRDEDIIIKKGYCLFRLKQYQCLENKILSRYSNLPRIQRLHLQYLFETKNFYKVLEILSRNTNNIDHQKMRVDSLFELNRYQECLDALKGLEFHMKRCTRLQYIKATCLKYTGRIEDYIKLSTTLIEEEKLNSNFIRKLLKGVLNIYMQDCSITSIRNYCSIFLKNTKYFKNTNKFQKYYTMSETFIQILKTHIEGNEEQTKVYCHKTVNGDSPQRCYICLSEFPLVFSMCKNQCEFICISCIQLVSIKCVKCMICKTTYQ